MLQRMEIGVGTHYSQVRVEDDSVWGPDSNPAPLRRACGPIFDGRSEDLWYESPGVA